MAVLVVVIVVSTFVLVRSLRSATSSKPAPSPTLTVPSGSGSIGTVNSGADNPAGSRSSNGADDSTCATVIRHTRIC
jgi:hypothetical protein